ncbi:MAG TPA: molybdate ABC transporter substrate-binding protein [Tepidisphaeraceae bacterium]|jgi:molybdate transport system substrate-binding protein
MKHLTAIFALIFLLLPLAALGQTGSASQPSAIKVAAAISLKECLTQAAATHRQQTGGDVELTFGSSGQLLAQIKSGAPVDLFISAADAQVDELIEQKLADGSTRKVIAGNQLVLILPKDSKDTIDSLESLADSRIRKLAIGEPKTVPAGQYAMQVIKKLKLQEALRDRLVYGASVRQVLDYVIRGEVSAGIVYSTDAKQAGEKVKLAATAKASLHDPIRYTAVIIGASKHGEEAKRFRDVLVTPAAQQMFQKLGFTPAEAK